MKKRNSTNLKLKENFKKSVIWNSIGGTINSFNSLFFLIIVTRINGINEAGLFTISYASACMFYAIGIYSGRTYQVTENNEKITDNEYVVNRLITIVMMILISLLFGLVNGYQNQKMIIFVLLCLGKSVEALSDVFHGILQKNNRLDIVGKSLCIRGLVGLTSFLIVELISKNMILACASLVIVNLIILIFVDIKISFKYKIKSRNIDIKNSFKILFYGFYAFGFLFIANYLVNAPRYAIDLLLTSDMQTIFGIIVMPASIIMLINQFIVQPIIIKLKREYESRNKFNFLKLIREVIILTIITGILAIIAAWLFGEVVLEFMYGIELGKYIPELLVIIGGATIYTISSVLSNSMVVLRKTKSQLYIYIVTAIIAFFTSYELVYVFGFQGAIYSYLTIMIILLLIYVLVFMKIVLKDKVFEVKK